MVSLVFGLMGSFLLRAASDSFKIEHQNTFNTSTLLSCKVLTEKLPHHCLHVHGLIQRLSNWFDDFDNQIYKFVRIWRFCHIQDLMKSSTLATASRSSHVTFQHRSQFTILMVCTIKLSSTLLLIRLMYFKTGNTYPSWARYIMRSNKVLRNAIYVGTDVIVFLTGLLAFNPFFTLLP